MLRTLRKTAMIIALGLGSLNCNDSNGGGSPPSGAFSLDMILDETNTPEQSASETFWLNSGAQFETRNNIGYTLAGDLPAGNKWHDHYAAHMPVTSDNGTHPQNVFRLFERRTLDNALQECDFLMTKYNVSASPARTESNGMLLVNRYQNGDNMYYAGIRVDGNAVIKKKLNGAYTTLALRPLFPGTYDKTTNPNLIPVNTWIGLRTDVTDTAAGVSIKLSQKSPTGTWEKILEATDASAVHGAGMNGLWTDFMDAEFKNYKLERATDP